MRFLEGMNLPENERSRTICEFVYGIDDSSGEYVSNEEVLSDCENMIYQKGKLNTRPGFSAIEESVVPPVEYADTVYLPFTVTDTVYYSGSKRYNVAYRCTGDVSFASLQVFFIDEEGNISSAGNIMCQRISESLFSIPTDVFFLVDRRVKEDGDGVFAFVTKQSYGDESYAIYEACGGFARWDNCESEIYVPTVRINGRGNRYDTASPLEDLNYPEPEMPETLNVLTGKFKCYFTADGLSSIFRLPYGSLDSLSPLVCRVYVSTDEYTEWVIPPTANHASAVIFGETVYLYVDRNLGVIRFWNGQSDYCIRIITGCPLNNIAVTAVTERSGGPGEIISSKGIAALGGRLYAYGNKIKPNCVYCAKQTEPLYFPDDAKLFLGDGTTGVTSLKVQNGKLIAFKPGEVYRIITSFSNEKYEKEAVLPETTLYIMGDKMKVQTIDTGIGCSAPKTIMLCGSRLVWLGSDGNAYALATTTYGNTINVYRVSRPVEQHIKAFAKNGSEPFAVNKDGYYILLFGGDVLIMNYKAKGFGYSKSYNAGDFVLKSPAWYRWKLPENAAYISAAGIGDGIILTSHIENGLSGFLSTVSGERDSFIIRENGENRTVFTDIRGGFTTKYLDLDYPGRLKTIAKVLPCGECETPATLTFSNGVQKTASEVRFSGMFDYVQFGTGLAPSYGLITSLYCKKPFSVKDITVEFKMLD